MFNCSYLEMIYRVASLASHVFFKFLASHIISQSKNLRDLIVRAELPKEMSKNLTENPGSYPCNTDAKNCNHMVSTQTFSNYTTKQSFVIHQHIICTTTNVMYLAVCSLAVFSSTSVKLARNFKIVLTPPLTKTCLSKA